LLVLEKKSYILHVELLAIKNKILALFAVDSDTLRTWAL